MYTILALYSVIKLYTISGTSLLCRALWVLLFLFQHRLHLANLLAHPAIPDNTGETTDEHEHREEPQCIVTQTRARSKKYQDTGKLVSDCFLSKLHGG